MSKYHIVRLGELISPANVIKCGTNIYPVLSMTMHDGIVLQSNRFKKSLASLDTSEYKVVKEGQLVVGFPIDEGVLYIQHHSFEGIMSPAYDVYNVDYSRITGVYLESALHSPQSMQYYASKLRGTTARRRSIPKKDLFELLIILPDLATQKHITDIISYANKLIEICKSILEKTDTLVKSRFVEMFEDLKDRRTIADLCSIITDGTHQPPKFSQSGIPFLFVSNIVKNEITYNAEKFISEETYNELYKRTPIEIGDIILSTVGSYGHPAVVKTDRKFLFQRHIAYLKPISSVINSIYLHSAILSNDAQRQIEERVKGIAQKTLNLSEIRKITIPIAPIPLQQQFADFVAQTDKSKYCLVGEQILGKAEMLIELLNQEYFG